jgi:hypothetical protein
VAQWGSQSPIEHVAGRDRIWRGVAFAALLVGLPVVLFAVARLLGLTDFGPVVSIGPGLAAWLVRSWVATPSRLATKENQTYWGPAPEDGVRQWDVWLAVVQDHVTTGKDVGKLWLQDGAICFSGKRTSFALSSVETRDRWCVDLVHAEFPVSRRAVRVKLSPCGTAQNWWVEIVPLDDENLRSMRALLAGAVWGQAPASGLGQYPPLSKGPGPSDPRRALVKVVVAAFASCLAAVEITWFLSFFLIPQRSWGSLPSYAPWLAVAVVSLVAAWLFRSIGLRPLRVLINYKRVMRR